MGRQGFVDSAEPFVRTDGPTATAAALTDISPTVKVINGYKLVENSVVRVLAFGRLTQAATPGTSTWGLYLAPPATAIASGNAVLVSAAIAGLASRTNTTWWLDVLLAVRTMGPGTTATVISGGKIHNVGAAAGSTDMIPASAPATFAFDSTVQNTLRLGYTPSLATASCVCHAWNVEFLN